MASWLYLRVAGQAIWLLLLDSGSPVAQVSFSISFCSRPGFGLLRKEGSNTFRWYHWACTSSGSSPSLASLGHSRLVISISACLLSFPLSHSNACLFLRSSQLLPHTPPHCHHLLHISLYPFVRRWACHIGSSYPVHREGRKAHRR